jgi:hypothetical protein
MILREDGEVKICYGAAGMGEGRCGGEWVWGRAGTEPRPYGGPARTGALR